MKTFVALMAAVFGGGLVVFGGAPPGMVNNIPDKIAATGCGFEVPLIQAGLTSTEPMPAFVEYAEVETAILIPTQDRAGQGAGMTANQPDQPKGETPYCVPSVRNHGVFFVESDGAGWNRTGGVPLGASLATKHDALLANLRRTIELTC